MVRGTTDTMSLLDSLRANGKRLEAERKKQEKLFKRLDKRILRFVNKMTGL